MLHINAAMLAHHPHHLASMLLLLLLLLLLQGHVVYCRPDPPAMASAAMRPLLAAK
jgi:hypothetical protein